MRNTAIDTALQAPLAPEGAARGVRGSLFRNYAVHFVALVSTVLVASAAVQLYFAYQQNKTTLLDLQREKATAAASRIETFVQGIESQLGWMRLPQADRATPEQRRIEYLKLLRQVPAITDVALLDTDGREQLHVSRLGMHVIGSQRDYSSDPKYVEPRQGKSYFSPVYFRKETEPYITIAVPGMGAAGITVAEVNLKFIWEVISRIKVGEKGIAYVVDSQGQLIAHPDISYVLRKSDLSALPQVKTALARRGSAGPHSVSIASSGDGREVLTAYSSIDALGWHVFAEQPLAEAFAPLYASLVRNGILLLGGLVLAIAASLYFARRMVTPIAAIQAGARRLAAGQLEERIAVNTGDELGALAEQFNRMAAQLTESYAGLERKVEERTQALSESLEQNVRLVAEIQEKSRLLEAANRHKSEFLASMSHELRTPLNAIIGFSEVLEERMFGELNEKQAEYLRDIHTSGTHILSLINDILDLSKIEAGRMDLEISHFDLPRVLENAVTLVRGRADRNRVALELQCEPGLSTWTADERKVKQIMLNLMSNAVKFTPAGGRVRVSARRTGAALAISVSDSGVGIRPEDQKLVFEEFRQVGEDPLKKSEGTGLGLALAKRFVELHGGVITVESMPGVGSTFTFTLPERLPEAA
jgi:signal transduction histidine kinase